MERSMDRGIERDARAIGFDWRALFPIAATFAALLVHLLIPNYTGYRPKVFPYFADLLLLMAVLFAGLAGISVFWKRLREKLGNKSWFYGASILALCLYDYITLKVPAAPSLYFPAPERIIQVFVTDWVFLLKCLTYSLRLLVTGFALGAAVGIASGILVGWSPRWDYWISPLIRIVGPIPSTAWITVALVVFTRAFDASVFLIALGVWFPTTVMTSSGILNVRKTYFEVSSTLGAGAARNVLRIAVPAAMPSIFTGLFNGASSSFITLMFAEMIGCKFGIGWYINWQREVLAYPNVFAAMILIALTFSLLISLQIRLRNRVLSWQKGTIRW